jgi:hypothetical protein
MTRRENVDFLTESLFSLEEPWRSRFLTLVAGHATGWRRQDEPLPTREEVTTWLNNQGLCRWVAVLLDVWQGARP